MDFDYSNRAEKSVESAQTKFFDDAYNNPRVDAIDPYNVSRRHGVSRGRGGWNPPEFSDARPYDSTTRNAIFYTQELLEIEQLLLAEIYFMEAVYMSQIYQYEQPHHIYSTFRHWVKPIEHQWHEWGQAASGFTNRLVTDARHNLGQPVWAFTKFASVCEAGNLGCAATVSELLQESGVNIPGSAGVYGLVDQLGAAGWQKIKIDDKQQFHAGDVVFGVHGSHGHIGIISKVDGDRVFVCDNSSSSGTLKERTIESGGSFTPNGRFAGNLYVMRATG